MAPLGVRGAGYGSRVVATLLDALLPLPTLVIGYIIWTIYAYQYGQTPGKMIVGIRAVRPEGYPIGCVQTAVREIVVKSIIIRILGFVTLGVIPVLDVLWPLWDRDYQALHDKMANTVVVSGWR